jgi:plastocyanin
VVFAAVLAAGLLLAIPPAAEGQTADITVLVRDGSYYPEEITIRPGDTVRWRWEADGYTVTHRPSSGSKKFDSDDACLNLGELEVDLECRSKGTTFYHTFDGEGTFSYSSNGRTARAGKVVVREPPPPPSDGDSGSSSGGSSSGGSSSGGSSSGGSSSGGSSSGGSSSGGSSGTSSGGSSGDAAPPSGNGGSGTNGDGNGSGANGEAAPSPDRASSSSTPRRATRGSAPRFTPGATGRTDSPSVGAPEVADRDRADRRDFEPFPTADPMDEIEAAEAPDVAETQPEDDQGQVDDLAITIPGGSTPFPGGRPALVGLALGSLLASAGVYAKVILFGAPW